MRQNNICRNQRRLLYLTWMIAWNHRYYIYHQYEKLLLPTQSPKKTTHTHAHYPRPPSLIHATRRLFHWFKKRTSFLTLVWSTCIQTDRNLKSRVTRQILFLHSTTYTVGSLLTYFVWDFTPTLHPPLPPVSFSHRLYLFITVHTVL